MRDGIMGLTCHTQVPCSSRGARWGGDDEPGNIFFSLAAGITQHFPTRARMQASQEMKHWGQQWGGQRLLIKMIFI